ncbi:hypothetical protein C8J56DRAFT_1038006 [Mycena floridula]|nr:hypothetical protein C8J56DRAFT_1038006 [Mycena floridula]
MDLQSRSSPALRAHQLPFIHDRQTTPLTFRTPTPMSASQTTTLTTPSVISAVVMLVHRKSSSSTISGLHASEIPSLLRTRSRARICVLGLGGIGKTELVLAVTSDPKTKRFYLDDNLVGVSCIPASPALCLDTLYRALGIAL